MDTIVLPLRSIIYSYILPIENAEGDFVFSTNKKKGGDTMKKRFLIDDALANGDLRFQKGKATGLVVSTLRRASAPLSMKEIRSRIKNTAPGKALEVKSILGRVAKTVGHFTKVKPFISENDGKYSLIEA